jgi:hypothetical protein
MEHRASNPVSIKNLNATETSATASKKVAEALYFSEKEED